MSYLKSLPSGASLSDIFKAFPRTSEPILRYCEAVLRGPSPLSEAEREMIAAYVSGLNTCDHCYGVHSGAAEAFGVAEGLVGSLIDDLETAAVDARMRPLLRFVRQLTLAPSRVSAAEVEEVYAAGWDDEALHAAVSVCALFNLFNRYTLGLGLEVAPEAAKERGRMLSEIGYAGLIERLGLAPAPA